MGLVDAIGWLSELFPLLYVLLALPAGLFAGMLVALVMGPLLGTDHLTALLVVQAGITVLAAAALGVAGESPPGVLWQCATRRVFIARDPATGSVVRWQDRRQPSTIASTVHLTRDDPGDMFVTLATFDGSVDLASVFDDLLGGSRRSDQLTLDLRGNPGGALLSATAELED